MTVFAGAVKHKITIAGVDVSELVGGGGTFFGVSDSKIDRGLILTSGSIAIMDNGTIDLDSRTNPTFSRGAPVIVEVELVNSSGVRTWFPHPRGALRILRDPAPPYPGNEFIEIEVGCLSTLLDFASPPDEDKQDKETKKEEKARSQLINGILSNLVKDQGIPNIQLQDTIADFPIAVEASKISSGSYISLCGDIAFGGGYALWIDNRERLRAVPIVPEKISHHFPDIVIGGDDGMEISYKPISGVEIPPSKYLFTADGDPSADDGEGEEEDDGCMTRKVYGSMADLAPDGDTWNELWLIEEKKCDRWEKDGDGWIRWVTTKIKRRAGLVYWSRGGQGRLIKEEGIQEKWYYNSDGILYKRETFEQRMPGELLKSLMDQIPDEVELAGGRLVDNYRATYSNFNVAVGTKPVKEVSEEWFFDEKTGVINKYKKLIKEPRGSVTASYYKFEMWRDKKYVTDEDKEKGEEGEEVKGKEEVGKKMFPAQIEEEFGYWPFESAYDLFNSAGWIMHLVTTYKEEQTWEEFRKDEWQWNKVVWQSQGRISSGDDTVSREDATGLRIDMEESEYILSNSGDSQPPEPETMTDAMQEGGTKETENIECEVEMSVPAYAEYRPKKKEIRIEFIRNEKNLCAIGHAIAAIDQGRVWLHELVLPLTLDLVENFQPVGFIKVQEHGRSRFNSDDRTFIYIAEGISWTLENDTALVSMDLILYNSAPNFFNRTYQWHSKPNPPPIIPTDPNDPIPPTPSPTPVPSPSPIPSPTPTPQPPIVIPKPIPVTKGGWTHGGTTLWFNFDPNRPEEFNLVSEWSYGGMTLHGDQIIELEGEYLHGSNLSEAYVPYVKAEYLWGYTGRAIQIIPKIINAEAWIGYGGNLVYIGGIHELTGGFSYGGILEYEDQSSEIAALNPRFWFRTDQGVTLDSTTYTGISAWQNQGSADSLSQPTKVNQPQYFKVGKIDAAFFETLTFLGTTDSGGTKTYYGFTAIMRSVGSNWASFGQVFSYPAQGAPASRSYLFESGQTYFYGYPFPVSVRKNKTNLASPFNLAPIDEWFCITVIFNPAYINNSISGSENWRINRTFENYYLGFYLTEIVTHDSNLSISSIEGIEDEMIARWSIGVPQNYTDITSFEPYYWFRSDMGLTIDTSAGTSSVSSWVNQGSGEDAIQSTKVNQPLIYSDANLGNVVHFTGSSWLSNHASAYPHVYGFTAIMRSVGSNWSSYGQAFGYPAKGAYAARSYLFESGQTYFHGYPFPVSVRKNKTNLASPFNLAPINEWFCITVVWDKAFKSSSIKNAINFYIGRSYEGYMARMYLAEIVVFSDSYSTTEIGIIEDEMIARWGI